MCNSVYTDVMQTIGVADPTLPQQPIPMQVGEGCALLLLLSLLMLVVVAVLLKASSQ